jgi:hypothetical protein
MIYAKQGGGCRLGGEVPPHLLLVARERGTRSWNSFSEAYDDREHELDRAIITAVHRAQRARDGKGYQFKSPKARQ